ALFAVEGASGIARGGLKVSGKFHTLGLAARESGGRLTEAQVAESYFFEDVELFDKLGHVGKKFEAFAHGEVEHVVDVLALITHLKHLRLIARALALFADQFDVGEELHFDGDGAVALAGFASAARNVEGEVSGAEAALVSFGKGSEKVADHVK